MVSKIQFEVTLGVICYWIKMLSVNLYNHLPNNLDVFQKATCISFSLALHFPAQLSPLIFADAVHILCIVKVSLKVTASQSRVNSLCLKGRPLKSVFCLFRK